MNESREAGWVREALAAARLPARARVGCLGPRAAELADVVRLLGHEPVAIAPDSGGPAAPDLD
ncbi:MAG TPA: hypothetical protein VFK69_04520, partial [Candidatus Eisenbacteria bacterium]|nr:hypothetical protein [Candidatus Eisenbacteria bacterium]